MIINILTRSHNIDSIILIRYKWNISIEYADKQLDRKLF